MPIPNSLLEESKHRALSEAALASLVAQGPDMLPSLLEAIHMAHSRAQKHNLARVIERMRGDATVTALLPLLDDADFQVRAAAMEALGKSGNIRALTPLVGKLQADRYSARADAATALGNLKLPDAIPALEQILTDILETPEDPQAITRYIAAEQTHAPDDWTSQVSRQLRLVIVVVAALAKLGKQHHAPLVVTLIDFHFAEDIATSYAARVREEAIAAAPGLAAPGLLPALLAARQREPSGDDVIDFSLLTALFYLGLRESVDEFVACFADDYPIGRASDEALERIAGLAGESPPGELNALKTWWHARRARFVPCVCYRWGQPLDVTTLAERLPGQLPIQTDMLLDELTMITGERFEPDYALPPEQQTVQRVTRAKAWIEQHATHFTSGSLYKYGYEQDIAAIF